MEIILSIFLTLEVKSYLILINIWEIVRILVISEKSDLGMHSAFAPVSNIGSNNFRLRKIALFFLNLESLSLIFNLYRVCKNKNYNLSNLKNIQSFHVERQNFQWVRRL